MSLNLLHGRPLKFVMPIFAFSNMLPDLAAMLAPLLIIGALVWAATRQSVRKSVEQISVSFKRLKLGLKPKITLEFLNPSNLKIEVTFIKIRIFYKEIEVASLSDFQTRIINPGPNDIELTLRPSLSALELFTIPKKTPRTIKVTWEIATKLYSIKGEKQTTI